MMRKSSEKYKEVCQQLEEVRSIKTLTMVKRMDIVGMTTTGAAKNIRMVQNMDSKIVVVEEAAEVLESHIVCCLSKSCEHLILIGDHKQLKPSPTVYQLAKDYHLDVSLFERMINNDVPYERLRIQHRMRPEIAALLKPHIYEDLENADSVHDYPDVKGTLLIIYVK
jgi:superfamily I DNA and/or RNA helicase